MTKTKRTFAQKAKSFLKNKKLKATHLNSYYSHMIDFLEEKIDNKNKRIKEIEKEHGLLYEAREEKRNLVFDIDEEMVINSSTRKDYAENMATKLFMLDRDKINPLLEEVEDLKKEISILQENINYLKSVEPLDEEDEEEENN